MKLRYKIIGVVALLLTLRSCFAPADRQPVVLPDNATAVVRVTPTVITTVTRDKVTGKAVIRADRTFRRGGDVIIRKDGEVEVKPKVFGLPNDFGLSTDFRSVGVATEFLYYKDLSLLGGSHFINMKTHDLQLNLFVAVGYSLPWPKFNNVVVYTGVDTDRKVTAGLFLRLGAS